MDDIFYMRRALELARRAAGRASPNPMVGAVLVKDGKIAGEGYHRRAGLPHAEIEALRRAGERARGATLYVNLEPCCHYGRTPPCVDALISAGVRRVVAGMRDPNKLVGGKGIRHLRAHGISVEVGLLRGECERLNEFFIKHISTGLPFVILKSAISLDGKMATRLGESQWITGAKARRCAHMLRGRVDAVMVGAGTVVKDDPRLTTRLGGRKNARHPARVILDNENIVPLTARVFANARTQKVIYAAAPRLPASKRNALANMGVEVCCLPEKDGGVDLARLLRHLGAQNITSVLLEGGGQLNGSAVRARVVDKVVLFLAPILIGGAAAPGLIGGAGIERLRQAMRLRDVTLKPAGGDFMLEGYVE